MSITIPDELAKRVLEALMLGSCIACNEGMQTSANDISEVRDELAALLTPKEAT